MVVYFEKTFIFMVLHILNVKTCNFNIKYLKNISIL